MGDLAHPGVAVLRAALEAAQDHGVPPGVELGHVGARRGRRLDDASGGHGQGRVPVERPRPGQHLVEDDAERVDIRRRRDLFAEHLFGRHVRRCPEDIAGLGQITLCLGGGGEPGDAKVGDHGSGLGLDPCLALAWHEDDVPRLEVAVDYPHVVGRLEPRDELQHERERFLRAEASLSLEPFGQGLPHEELHAEEGYFSPALAGSRAVKPDFEDTAHVVVCDLAGELDLAFEALEPARFAGQLRAEELQGHALLKDEVFRCEDLPHAALGEKAGDAIAATHDLPIFEDGAHGVGSAATSVGGLAYRAMGVSTR